MCCVDGEPNGAALNYFLPKSFCLSASRFISFFSFVSFCFVSRLKYLQLRNISARSKAGLGNDVVGFRVFATKEDLSRSIGSGCKSSS